jgi:two-component system, cell cycle sensor histidine kinase and response regulator CckA
MSPTGNGRTILLAEDEQPVRSVLLAMLKKNGYNVIVAVDGQDALEKARQFDEAIHLLLSNVQMPKMTGIELATLLTMERPDTRVLLMSRFPGATLLLNTGWQFLPKPFMEDMLKTRILDILQDRPANDDRPHRNLWRITNERLC